MVSREWSALNSVTRHSMPIMSGGGPGLLLSIWLPPTALAGGSDGRGEAALEIAEQIPFRFLVQHLGLPNESFSEKKFDRR